GFASPPSADTRRIGWMLPIARRITPSRLHVPPVEGTAFRGFFVDPVSRSIRLNVPSAKKPIERLSGDQNGTRPRSVPTNGRDVPESSERSHNRDCSLVVAANTILRPSGDTASVIGSDVGGVTISRCVVGDSGTTRNGESAV